MKIKTIMPRKIDGKVYKADEVVECSETVGCMAVAAGVAVVVEYDKPTNRGSVMEKPPDPKKKIVTE